MATLLTHDISLFAHHRPLQEIAPSVC